MPSSPSSLPSALVLLFAVACGLSVANVYYAQPLLDVLGAEFAIGQAGVGLLCSARASYTAPASEKTAVACRSAGLPFDQFGRRARTGRHCAEQQGERR